MFAIYKKVCSSHLNIFSLKEKNLDTRSWILGTIFLAYFKSSLVHIYNEKASALASLYKLTYTWLFREEIAFVDNDSYFGTICHTIYWFHGECNEEGLLIWVAEVTGAVICIAAGKALLTRAQQSPHMDLNIPCTPPSPSPPKLNDLNIAVSSD